MMVFAVNALVAAKSAKPMNAIRQVSSHFLPVLNLFMDQDIWAHSPISRKALLEINPFFPVVSSISGGSFRASGQPLLSLEGFVSA